MSIASSLSEIRARIASAAARAGRSAETIRLIAVSKTKPASMIREAYAAGQRDFGENYAQELDEKQRELADLPELRWHFIGHLQSNKAKLVAPCAAMVHAVDDAKVARELAKRSEGRASPLPVLVEVNVGGEASKAGVEPEALGALLAAIEAEPRLKLDGLMSIPPPSADPEAARVFHRRLRALRDEHGGAKRLANLSMGMSDDLEVAIEEGATLVRVGTAIFGARGAMPARV
jgi:pyridoxal phosphate enzyme (YggS family)